MRARRQVVLHLPRAVFLGLLVLACSGPTQGAPGATAPAAPAASPVASPPAVSKPVASPASPSASPAAFPVAAQSFAVLLDNNVEGRPQSGLDSADVVYEAPAEGGIPRLLALYLRETQPERIGPVRSARHYFVYLAAEYRVPLVHIGSSPQGFEALQGTGLERVDEAEGHAGFTRAPDRPAPHNAFVRAAAVRSELERRGLQSSASTSGLSFGAFQPGGEPATRLRIVYAEGGFTAEYTYDPGSRTYQRSQDGQPHVDALTNRRYAPHSVIVQQIEVTPIPNDDAGRVELGLVGSGTGLLIAEGTSVALQWSKSSPTEPTRFTRHDGAAFSLPDGQVWIELVPRNASVEVS